MSIGKRYDILFYTGKDGKCPVDEFLNALPVKAKAKVEKWMELLELHGPSLPRPFADVLRGKIRELRVHFASQQYRFLYFFAGKKIILTHGFVKKTSEVPEEEIYRGLRLMHDFWARIGKREMD